MIYCLVPGTEVGVDLSPPAVDAVESLDVLVVEGDFEAREVVLDVVGSRRFRNRGDALLAEPREAHLCLAWLREKGVTAIPKATGPDHIEDNLSSLGVALDDEDVERLDGIDRDERQVDPDFGPWN